ncbi:hypothetical protein MMC20_003094 [Loxospora ochrophaea]|nr:hypothetical protein [Loxospora ochrophaea]
MPVYLLHGFRWPRSAIRIHVILNNIEDAAAEWLTSPSTSAAVLKNLHELYPKILPSLPNLRFVEQYDPNDTSENALSQPFAFVADKIETIPLSLDINEAIKRGVDTETWGAVIALRDELAPQESVGWWVVYNGDEGRSRQQNGEAGNGAEDSEVGSGGFPLLLHIDQLTIAWQQEGSKGKGKLKKLMRRSRQ